MAFSYAFVSVSDREHDRFVQTEMDDPAELRELIDMNLSYKIHPEIKRQVTTDYSYEVNLARDGRNLDVVYAAPTEITIQSTSPKAGLCAELSYKKKTGELNVRRLTVTYNINEDDAPPTDAEVADEIAQLAALFRVAGEIAPLTFGERLKVSRKACIVDPAEALDPATVRALAKRAAALRAGVKKQLAKRDVLAMLR